LHRQHLLLHTKNGFFDLSSNIIHKWAIPPPDCHYWEHCNAPPRYIAITNPEWIKCVSDSDWCDFMWSVTSQYALALSLKVFLIFFLKIVLSSRVSILLPVTFW
jgi:hypothetical protein